MLDAKQTNNRKVLRWWDCQRCGVQFPEDKIVRQRGYVLCQGGGTNNCVDQHGAAYHRRNVTPGYEQVPNDPPEVPWEDD
jgi:hypothetical protein